MVYGGWPSYKELQAAASDEAADWLAHWLARRSAGASSHHCLGRTCSGVIRERLAHAD